ncbi:hypothetical protein GCM10009582_07570 [Arthrobacter flavus]
MVVEESTGNAELSVENLQGLAKVTDRDAQSGSLTLEVPGSVSEDQLVDPAEVPAELFEGKGDALINTELPSAVISTFATSSGSQSIIKIESAAAAKEYRFPLEVPEGAVARVLADGAVEISAEDGSALGSVQAPWAIDANGRSVPTSFEIEGNTLVQTVEHNSTTAFPVVADPSTVWGWTVCTATIGALVAGNLLIASKIAKIGGVAKVVTKLKAAKNAQARYKALIAFFGEFTGIAAVMNNCK